METATVSKDDAKVIAKAVVKRLNRQQLIATAILYGSAYAYIRFMAKNWDDE